MRLSDRVLLTLSGDLGCSLSHPADCNAYALDCNDQVVLIDAGLGVATQAIVDNLRADGIPSSRIASLLLTHGHLDHSGGAHWLWRELDLEVVASTHTATALANQDEQAIDLDRAKAAGIYEPGIALHACPVQRRLHGGERWSVGDVSLLALPTPGHSDDMMCYLAQTPDELLAFVGDTVFHGGKVLLQALESCRPAVYGESLRTLNQHPIDGLFPGHGLWSLRRGAEQIRKSMSYVNKLLMPPNLL